MVWRLRWTIGVQVLGWGLLGCQREAPPPAGVFRIGLFAPYTSLDPLYARDQISAWLVQQLFAGLVGYDSLLRPIPSLATRWEISPDARVYRFYLRKGVTFHGRPFRRLRASDVVYSWHRLASPKWASPGAYLFRGLIRGWKDFQEGKTPTIAGLRALSDSVLEVELEAPYGPFLHLLTLPYAMVVLPEAAESLGRAFGRQPVGCGPFQLEWQEPGRLLVFRRHEPASAPSAQKLVFRWFPNRLWAWEALKRGEIDAFEGQDRALEYLFRSDSTWRRWAVRIETPQLGTEYLGMDGRPGRPLADPGVRRALRAVIWRLPLVEQLLGGHATPARSFVPPPLLAYLPRCDTTLADTLLQKLQGLRLTLYAQPAFRELCDYLELHLRSYGVDLRIEYLLGPSLREFISKGQVAFWKASWLADYPDGENFLLLFESSQWVPQGPNTTRFAHRLLDSLLQAARRSVSDSVRRTLYAQAESLLSQEVPVIPLYHGHGIWQVSRRWAGFPCSPLPVWLPLGQVRYLGLQELPEGFPAQLLPVQKQGRAINPRRKVPSPSGG